MKRKEVIEYKRLLLPNGKNIVVYKMTSKSSSTNFNKLLNFSKSKGV